MSLKSRKSIPLFTLGLVVLLLFTACGGTSEGGSKKDLSFEDAARLVIAEVVIPESLWRYSTFISRG